MDELLSHYASLLASQGDLATAITYLKTSHDAKVVSLRERLYVALGHKPQVQDIRQQQPSRRGENINLLLFYFTIRTEMCIRCSETSWYGKITRKF